MEQKLKNAIITGLILGLCFSVIFNMHMYRTKLDIFKCYIEFDKKALLGDIDRNMFKGHNCYYRGDYIDVYSTTYDEKVYWFRCYLKENSCINLKIYEEFKLNSEKADG